MSVFDHININQIKEKKYINDLERRKARFRIDKYYEIKTKKFMDFYRGFHRFALSNNLPSRVFKSSGLCGEKFRGWMLTPRFGISEQGDFYYNNVDSQMNGVPKKVYRKNNDPIIFTDDGSDWCRYDSHEKAIIVKDNTNEVEYRHISMETSDIEYYMIVGDLIDSQLQKYAEACIEYAINASEI